MVGTHLWRSGAVGGVSRTAQMENGGERRRNAAVVVPVAERWTAPALIATDEELGGASEGVDVASSSFPSITNRGLSNQ